MFATGRQLFAQALEPQVLHVGVGHQGVGPSDELAFQLGGLVGQHDTHRVTQEFNVVEVVYDFSSISAKDVAKCTAKFECQKNEAWPSSNVRKMRRGEVQMSEK